MALWRKSFQNFGTDYKADPRVAEQLARQAEARQQAMFAEQVRARRNQEHMQRQAMEQSRRNQAIRQAIEQRKLHDPLAIEKRQLQNEEIRRRIEASREASELDRQKLASSDDRFNQSMGLQRDQLGYRRDRDAKQDEIARAVRAMKESQWQQEHDRKLAEGTQRERWRELDADYRDEQSAAAQGRHDERMALEREKMFAAQKAAKAAAARQADLDKARVASQGVADRGVEARTAATLQSTKAKQEAAQKLEERLMVLRAMGDEQSLKKADLMESGMPEIQAEAMLEKQGLTRRQQRRLDSEEAMGALQSAGKQGSPMERLNNASNSEAAMDALKDAIKVHNTKSGLSVIRSVVEKQAEDMVFEDVRGLDETFKGPAIDKLSGVFANPMIGSSARGFRYLNRKFNPKWVRERKKKAAAFKDQALRMIAQAEVELGLRDPAKDKAGLERLRKKYTTNPQDFLYGGGE